MKTVFIGDIHGCLDEFRALVDKCRVEPGDRVVCLGDFLDKGPDGAGCVRFARETGMLSVLGNHEDWYLRWRRHELKRQKDPKYVNPMKAMAAEGPRQIEGLNDQDWAWLEALPLYLRFTGLVAVHGGIRPGHKPETHDKGEMLRLRWVDVDGKHVPVDYDRPGGPGTDKKVTHWVERYDGPDHVVYGHEAHTLSRPHVYKTPRGARCFGIDTGCVHGGHLTALLIHEDGSHSFEQVRGRAYRVPHAPIPWA